jgi:Tfp pilus assembly protein PilN
MLFSVYVNIYIYIYICVCVCVCVCVSVCVCVYFVQLMIRNAEEIGMLVALYN